MTSTQKDLGIAIIVPVGPQEPGLDSCLLALQEQDYPSEKYEIVLSAYDGGESYFPSLKTWTGLRILPGTTEGIYRAKNRGASLSQGEAILFIHPQCRAEAGWLTAFSEGLRNSDLLLGYCANASAKCGMQLLEEYENHKARVILTSDATHEYFAYSNNLAVRRSVFEQAGGFPVGQAGGATLLVQKLAVSSGGEKIGFCSGARVILQPLTGLLAYLNRRHLYGFGAHLLRHRNQETTYRLLQGKRRASLFRSLCQEKKLGLKSRLILAVHLFLGWLSFESGRIRAQYRLYVEA